MKKFSLIPLFLVSLCIIIGLFAVQQYFSYIGPKLADKAAVETRIKELEYQRELLNLNTDVTERALRTQATTNLYLWFTLIVIIGVSATVAYLLWHNYDKRKESWARAVDGMFALQTETRNGITWHIDPNKTFTSAIGVNNSGAIAELPVAKEVTADRQLENLKSAQVTRNAIAISQGVGSKYAAPYKFLSGAYNRKMLSSTNGKDYEEIDAEPVPIISLNQAIEESTSHSWITGQSEIDGVKCTVNIYDIIHLAVIGAPNVGKTASTGLLLAYYAKQYGFHVICLDAKGGIDWKQYEGVFEVQETNETVFPSQFGTIAKVHNERQVILRSNGWQNYKQSNGTIQPLFIILEEFGYLMSNLQATNKVLYAKLLKALTTLMRVSRATGIYFCLIDQTTSDWPSDIKGIIKFYIAYKLNGAQGNAVKLYYLDKLNDVGEFCTSSHERNKFKAWHTAEELDVLSLPEKSFSLLPVAQQQEPKGVVVNFLEEDQALLAEPELTDELIVSTYRRLGSLNKTTKELFDGKVGAYYTAKIKPALIKEGLISK